MRKRVQTGFACPIFVMKMEWASMGNIPKLERAKYPYYGFARIVPDTFPRQGAMRAPFSCSCQLLFPSPTPPTENHAVNPEVDDIHIILATTGERKEASSKRKPFHAYSYALLVGEPHTPNDK